MANPQTAPARWSRWLNHAHARAAAIARPATGFVSQPEPRTVGAFARGRQLVAGNYVFAGHLIEAEGRGLWDITPPDDAFAAELHGFVWLDDLAAVGEAPARRCAQDWLWRWISEFGNGKGPGWTPDLTGRRIIRWIHHALFVLRGRDGAQSQAFYRSLAQQSIFLGRRWHSAAPGLPRFEALTGLLYAGVSLQGMERHVDPAARALDRECIRQIDAEGGIPTRNPEELLEVFTLLTWAQAVLQDTGRPLPAGLRDAVGRIAPTLRSLRHADGGLARFHGGGRGLEGRLDAALASSGIAASAPGGLAMGFARLGAGRSSIVIDAAPPPRGPASCAAHASTLAFELTSGRRPVIVNSGAGAVFGAAWQRAGRATASHSTLALDGYSSARLGTGPARQEWLVDVPRRVPVEITHAGDGVRFQGGHDGYLATHGLTHARTLDLTLDGRGLAGEDLLVALDDADRAVFDRALDQSSLQGIGFTIRFHIHPEVEATLDMGGAAVSLALKSGELWVFRHDGSARMTLEPSVYLEKGRLRPRGGKQIVLTARAMDYATRTRWSLAKAQETPIAIRDVTRDETDLTRA